MRLIIFAALAFAAISPAEAFALGSKTNCHNNGRYTICGGDRSVAGPATANSVTGPQTHQSVAGAHTNTSVASPRAYQGVGNAHTDRSVADSSGRNTHTSVAGPAVHSSNSVAAGQGSSASVAR